MSASQQDLSIAIAHQKAGRLQAAESIYRQIISADPSCAAAWYLLGLIHARRSEAQAAASCFQRAIELGLDDAEVRLNLGLVQQALGSLDEAIASYRRAVELKPDNAEALNNLGNTLQEQGQFNQAVACYQSALQYQPQRAETWRNLGSALRQLDRRDESIASYYRALELRPDYLTVLGALIYELQEVCEWGELTRLAQQAVTLSQVENANPESGSLTPFAFLSLPTATTPQQQQQAARRWARQRLPAVAEGVRDWSAYRERRTSKRITIGYLSADFRVHAMTNLVAELFEKHNHEAFNVIGYSYGPDDQSPVRDRIRLTCDRFVDLEHDSFRAAAERIAADNVDILVDLTGFTRSGRPQILALRPAPIQVSFLGFTGTMGTTLFDYLLVDDFVVPAAQQPFFDEKLVHLPGSYLIYDSQLPIDPHVPSRSDCGLPAEGFVFCNFNSNHKITPTLFDVWMRLLKSVPKSVLWILAGHPMAQANLIRWAAASGVDSERLVFASSTDHASHLARHQRADLFLDTFPYNGHTTAADALWAGCPVLTLAGQTFASRVAGSLLRSLSLSELITSSQDEYFDTALRLANDKSALLSLRERLQANRSTSGLFDTARSARGLEQAYTAMLQNYQSGNAPRPIQIRS